jgi:hypothetical protein
MASNAASSVQFRVNGTEMARGRTRKTERSQNMDPRAKPRAAGRLKGKRRDNSDERGLSSVPKTQATSVLPVAREESQRLSAGDFPESDFGPASLRARLGVAMSALPELSPGHVAGLASASLFHKT